MQCVHEPFRLSPPCMFTERKKNASFESLLDGKPAGIRETAPICPVDAIKLDKNGIWIEEKQCVGCLLCAAACPISAITLDQALRAHLLSPDKSKETFREACPWGASDCRETSTEDMTRFRELCVEKRGIYHQETELTACVKDLSFEKCVHVTRSYINHSEAYRTNFEEFSRSDEVTKLTPWMGEALKRISSGTPISGYEARLPNKPGMRYPRLDFSIIDREAILVVESKRDEGSAKAGIVDQIEKKYREEIRAMLSKRHMKKWNILLSVGGNDRDLSRSNFLFSILRANGIQMMSASFVWSLFAFNLLSGKRLLWSRVIPSIFSNKNVLALLASGVVMEKVSNRFELVPFAKIMGDTLNAAIT
jgi:Fe-S-cluster-containing hydrogenase component 2